MGRAKDRYMGRSESEVSMAETTNYNLKKPTDNEYADIADINDNMDIIDASLKQVADKIEEAADKPQLNITTITIPKGRVKGDIDGDGEVQYDDTGSNWSINSSKNEIEKWVGDTNNDGYLNVSDADQIARFAVGKTSTLTRTPTFADYYANWIYEKIDDYIGKFYTDIPIVGMTENCTANITVKGSGRNKCLIGAECIDGAIRVYSRICPPIEELPAVVIWSAGDGTATISEESSSLRTVFYANINNNLGWENINDRYYTASISMYGILSSDTPITDLMVNDYTSIESLESEWSKVFKIETFDDSIKVYATEIPAETLMIQLKVVR